MRYSSRVPGRIPEVHLELVPVVGLAAVLEGLRVAVDAVRCRSNRISLDRMRLDRMRLDRIRLDRIHLDHTHPDTPETKRQKKQPRAEVSAQQEEPQVQGIAAISCEPLYHCESDD